MRLRTAREWAGRTLIAVSVAAGVLVVLVGAWYTANVLLLVFGAVLAAVFFQGLAARLCQFTGLSYGWSLTIVFLTTVAVVAMSVWWRAPAVWAQVSLMQQQLPAATEKLTDAAKQLPFGETLVRNISGAAWFAHESGAGPRRVFSTTASTLAHSILVLFVTLYVAGQPSYYRRGLLSLVPSSARGRAEQITLKIGDKLWWWLLARLAAMSVVGIAITTGLWLLGIPLALTLGIVAALLDFVPNFGPIVAAIPAVLLALMVSPQHALYVLLLYWGVQILEGYIVTPWFQQRAIDMPPALIVTAQVVLGTLLGTLGLVFATPVTAIAILLLEELYVEGNTANE